jgi:hypothetical protein
MLLIATAQRFDRGPDKSSSAFPLFELSGRHLDDAD